MQYYIRQAEINDGYSIAKVHVNSWKSTYRGLISDKILDALQPEDKILSWENKIWESINLNDQKLLLVVCDRDHQNEIIGFLFAGKPLEWIEKYDFEIYTIYILQEFQKLGIGRDLFQKAEEFKNSISAKSMIVWVLENNPAELFYQKMGGIKKERKEVNENGNLSVELGYVWEF